MELCLQYDDSTSHSGSSSINSSDGSIHSHSGSSSIHVFTVTVFYNDGSIQVKW